jgi:hypothetical protein
MSSVQRLRKKNITGTLNGSLAAGATTLAITPDATSDSLPAVSSPFIMAVTIEPDTANEEVIWITSCSAAATSSITIVKGQENTNDITHSTGVAYKHGPTILDHPPTNNDSAWTRATTATTNDDEFNESALDSAWVTVLPSGTQSLTVGADSLSVKVNSNGASTAACCIKPLNGFAIGNMIETAVRTLTIQNYIMAGPILTNGTTTSSSCVWLMPYWFVDACHLSLRSGAINNISSSLFDFSFNIRDGLLYQRLKWVAANSFQAFFSTDGVQWTDFGQGAKAITLTPTNMGFGTSTWGGTNDSLASYEYFRVI